MTDTTTAPLPEDETAQEEHTITVHLHPGETVTERTISLGGEPLIMIQPGEEPSNQVVTVSRIDVESAAQIMHALGHVILEQSNSGPLTAENEDPAGTLEAESE